MNEYPSFNFSLEFSRTVLLAQKLVCNMIRVRTWFLCERQKPNAIMIAGDMDLGVYYNKAKVLLQNSRRATRGGIVFWYCITVCHVTITL